MGTKRASAPIKIILTIALVMVAFLASGCMAVQKQRADSDMAKKQKKFVIETALQKAELFTQLTIAARRTLGEQASMQFDRNAGVISGSYVSAVGTGPSSYDGSAFKARQTVAFRIQAEDKGSVALELQTNDYVPSDTLAANRSLTVLRGLSVDREKTIADRAEERADMARAFGDTAAEAKANAEKAAAEAKKELFYLTASELESSWENIAKNLAMNLGGKVQ